MATSAASDSSVTSEGLKKPPDGIAKLSDIAVTSSHSSVTSSSSAVTSSGTSAAASALPDPHRLWIGNIQPHVAEYQLLKLARPIGTITRFDFMLHQTAPMAGKPRGYAFISYASHEDAARARVILSGASLGGVRLNARWAHEPVPVGTPVVEKETAPCRRGRHSAEIKIRAIEAKLCNMDKRTDDLVLDTSRKDVWRLPKVKGPLQMVNQASKLAHSKPYQRKK